DGPDRPVDQLAWTPSSLVAAREQAPQAGPEVGPAEDGVEGHADQQDDGDRIGLAHPDAPAARSAGGPASGPYGTSTSCSSASRQRRDIARSVMTRAAPSAA